MASRYAVATGNWNDTAVWSATDGGAPGASFPVDGDAVLLTATSGAITVTVNVSSACTSLTCTGFTGTFAGSSALQIKGNIVAVAGMTWTYSGVITAALTAGTATLTSAGKTLCSGLTMNGAGGTLTFADAFVTTGTCTLTAGTWNDGNVNLTMAAWVNTGSTTRVIVYGTNCVWTVTGSGTCWNESGTGCTNNAVTRCQAGGKDGVATVDFTYSGSSARTQIRDGEFAWVMPKVKVSAGSGTFTMGSTSGTYPGGVYAHGLDFTGFSGTYTPAATSGSYRYLICVGSFTLSTSMVLTTPTSSTTAQFDISGSRLAGETTTVTFNGQTVPYLGASLDGYGVGINGAVAGGSTIVFADAVAFGSRVQLGYTSSPAVTLTFQGNVTALGITNSYNYTRTINMGSGTWTLTSTDATAVFNLATTTGLTLNPGTATIDLTGVTANTRTITSNSVLMPKVKVSAGSGAVVFTNANYAGLEFGNSYSGTISNQTMTIRGPVTLSNHASFALTAGANAWTLASTSGSHAFTSQGKACDFPITVNGVGGTHAFADAFTHGITRTLTLTNGTVDFGSYTHTMGFFASSNANVRVIATGTATLNFPTTGTVWDTSTSTNLTVTGTGTIALTANSATARTITGGSALLPSLSMATGSFAPTLTACNFLNITVTSGYTGTVANQALTWRGNLSLAATGAVFSAGSNAWTWANTSGTVTSTINGRTLDFPVIVNGSATHQLADALTLGSAKALTHTAGTLDLASYVATAGSYVSANSNTRVLATGTGTLALAGTGVVYDTSTSTNWSFTGTGTIKLTDSSGTARSITAGTTRLPSLWVSAGTSTTTMTNVTGCIDLNMTGMGAGTIAAGAGAFAIGGSVTFVAAGTWSYTGALTFDATTTGKTITSAGLALTSSTVAFNGVGGGWTLQDNAPATGAWSLVNGALSVGNFTASTPSLTASGSATRSLTFGSGVVTLSGTGTVLDASGTGLTVTPGTGAFSLSDASGTARTVTGASGVTLPQLRVTAGSGSLTTTSCDVNGFDCTGFTGNWENNAITVRDDIVLPAGMTASAAVSAATRITATNASGTSLITMGITFDRSIYVGGATWKLGANLVMGSGRALYVDSALGGAFDDDGFTLTAGGAGAFGTGAASWTQRATYTMQTTGTAWSMPSTMTHTWVAGGIKYTNNSATGKTFAGGGKTYGEFWFAPATGAGDLTVTGSNTFSRLKDDGTIAHAWKFTAGTTQNVADWQISGNVGQLITVTSATAAQHYLIATGTPLSADYLDISHSIATPAASWEALSNSVDSGDNFGWFGGGSSSSANQSAIAAARTIRNRQTARDAANGGATRRRTRTRGGR